MTSSSSRTDQDTRQQKSNEWFKDVISHFETDRFLYTEKLAADDTKLFYDDVIHGDSSQLFRSIREQSTKFFITKLVKDYFSNLKGFTIPPRKVALALSDSKIMVWAEIEDNDEASEDILLMAEAHVNLLYSEKGFYISSTIVEASDNLPVPPHFMPINYEVQKEEGEENSK